MPVTEWWQIAVQWTVFGLALYLAYKGVWMFKADHNEIIDIINNSWQTRFDDMVSYWEARYALMSEARDNWREVARFAAESTHTAVNVTGEIGSKLANIPDPGPTTQGTSGRP